MKKFTLIELLVVVAILGILVSILLPSLSMARIKSKIAVCKSNMKQVGIATATYMIDSPLPHPPIFRSGTGDHPHEGRVNEIGRVAPGNAAAWSYPYLESHQNVFFCPLAITERTFARSPHGLADKFWGTSIYLFGKAANSDDPYAHYRATGNNQAAANNLTTVNDISEDVMMFDTWSNETLGINFDFEHYNTLMLDGSVKEPAKTKIKMRAWLFIP